MVLEIKCEKSEDLINEYHKKYHEPLFDWRDELYVTLVVYMKIPKSFYKYSKRLGKQKLTPEGEQMLAKKIRPSNRRFNYQKILKQLEGVAYYDQKQITTLLVMKFFGEENETKLIIEKWG